MKKLLCALFVTAILPHFEPMFPGMIVRCDEQGHCHWECEFGVETATTTVNDNVILKSVGCSPKITTLKLESKGSVIYSPLQQGDTVYPWGGTIVPN